MKQGVNSPERLLGCGEGGAEEAGDKVRCLTDVSL